MPGVASLLNSRALVQEFSLSRLFYSVEIGEKLQASDTTHHRLPQLAFETTIYLYDTVSAITLIQI